MTRFTRVRLAPRGPFHFGGRGVGLEHTDIGLPADTLFSALCVTLAEHEGSAALAGLLARFTGGKPPFRLTSLMPCASNVYLLPYPLIAPPHADDLRRRKLFKDIAWVSEAVFRPLVHGQGAPADALAHDAPVTIQGGKVWVTAAEKAALQGFTAHNPETDADQPAILWRTAVRPHVTVDRTTSASSVFAGGATHFNRAGDDPAGLYTVIEWLDADAALRDQVERTFVRLGQSGIGGERSNGYGQFEPHPAPLDQWAIGAPAGPYFTTLSPYHPQPDEASALHAPAHYEIVVRRGWLSLPGYTSIRRGALRLLAEGSVLAWPAGITRSALGDVVDVTPQRLRDERAHHIYRYGLAFPVGVAAAALQRKETGP